MTRIFGERWQKARKEHFCDFCGEWIQQGETYSRSIYVFDGGDFVIMKEHAHCPEDDFDRTAPEVMQEACIAIRMALETQTKAVLVRQFDGSFKTEYESCLVTKMVFVDESAECDNTDVEIPF